jgi:aryl-alcohol dehydrogenase-like predicted oxidoreductase
MTSPSATPLPYTFLGSSGLRVSALCLGTMTFGEEWGWGADKDTSGAIFTRFAECGGNFVDTANNYTGGTSERWVGEFVRADRDRFVIGTKYSLSTVADDPNAGGNHRKSMRRSIESSLRRLGTDHVDVLWLHVWDSSTPIDEILRGLDDLVRTGKVLHIGISDVPAWVVARANTVAELRGWTSFVALQGEYSLARRDAERDLLPVADAFGMTFMPWSPLANGLLTGKYLAERTAQGRMADTSPSRNRPDERGMAIASEVLAVARELERTPAQVALAWLREQPGSIIPIVGARRLEQLEDDLGCLSVELTATARERLDTASRIELGFPHDFLRAEFFAGMLHGDIAGRIHASAPIHRRTDLYA